MRYLPTETDSEKEYLILSLLWFFSGVCVWCEVPETAFFSQTASSFQA